MCAVKNEKGVTLIELLGVLVILSIVLTLAGSILTSSLKMSNRATADQRLQQEANYITEAIRNKYLEKTSESIHLKIDNNRQKLFIKDEAVSEDYKVLSEGYMYSFCLDEHEACEIEEQSIFRFESHQAFQLKLESKDGQRNYIIDTKFSKLK